MPIDEIDIYRKAGELIRQHGDKATIHAAMRADATTIDLAKRNSATSR